MVTLRPGARLRSTTCATEVIVVKGTGDTQVDCGGAPMVAAGTDFEPNAVSPDAAGGTVLGKRYSDPDGTVELLCTKAGEGSLALGGTPLAVMAPKTLPASD